MSTENATTIPNPYPPIPGVPHDALGYPISLLAGEYPPGIDWQARKARARRWLVEGRMSETPYPADHEPVATDIPSPKPRTLRTTF